MTAVAQRAYRTRKLLALSRRWQRRLIFLLGGLAVGAAAVLLAIAAGKFGCRPSLMVGLRDPVLALDFDLAAAAKLLEAERAVANAVTEGFEETPFAGQRARNVHW